MDLGQIIGIVILCLLIFAGVGYMIGMQLRYKADIEGPHTDQQWAIAHLRNEQTGADAAPIEVEAWYRPGDTLNIGGEVFTITRMVRHGQIRP